MLNLCMKSYLVFKRLIVISLLFNFILLSSAAIYSQKALSNDKKTDRISEKFDGPLNKLLQYRNDLQNHKVSLEEYTLVKEDVTKGFKVPANQEKVLVEIYYLKNAEINEKELLGFGIQYDDRFSIMGDIVQALVPIDSLKQLSSIGTIRQISIPMTPVPDEISEGVGASRAINFTNKCYTGQGIKIAVLDIGFLGYETLLGNELPNNVITKSFYNSIGGNGDITGSWIYDVNRMHGTACAEIVYDMAPGAQLYLVNYNTLAEMEAAVDYLIGQKVNIISHSCNWYNQSFYNGEGPVCALVTEAKDNGILWVNSAGNRAWQHWEGKFNDPNQNNKNMFGYEFGKEDETMSICAKKGEQIKIVLTWNDWFFQTTDYDLYLLDTDGNEVASSLNAQDGWHNPTESIVYTVTSDQYSGWDSQRFQIVIQKMPGEELNFDCELFSIDHNILEYGVKSSSLGDPAPSEDCLAVGTIGYNCPTEIKFFSSQGPTTDGRVKPDITGYDNVKTKTFSFFAGTSAAAANVAGAAALVWSEKPSRTASEVQKFLEDYAKEFGESGKDNIYGSGLLRLPEIPYNKTNEVADVLSYKLMQNYPNPFNPVTNISYSIPANGNVELKVYDILGREIAILVDEEKTAGNYEVAFNSNGLPSGVYFYAIRAGYYSDVKKLIVLK